jgi:hypothetical protein
MENGKNMRWIVRSDVKESNRETIELVGGRRLLCVCNRVIWYCVTQEDKNRTEKMSKL